jgi:molecular chaperone HscB
MTLNLQSTDFELFGLPSTFAQDREAIDARWKELQREAHPDRFAAQGQAAQRIAMQWSVRINEAYQRLKDPLKRAAYLCELRGAPVEAQNNTAMPADFLVEQMAWREAFERIEQCLDQRGDAAAAAQQVRALMFIERFGHDVQARFEQLGQ